MFDSLLTILMMTLSAAAAVCALIELFVWRKRRMVIAGNAHLYVGQASSAVVLVGALFQLEWHVALGAGASLVCFIVLLGRARDDAPSRVVSDEPRLPLVAPDSAEIRMPTPAELEAQRGRR